MNDGQGRRTYKKLTLPQQVKCTDWIRQNWATIQKDRPTYRALCDQMTAALGFTVPLASGPALVEAVGFEWPGGRSKTAGPKADRPRILARAICDLYSKLGEPCPADVKAILDSTSAPDPSRPLLP